MSGKENQRSLDRRLPVEQGGRKPPGEAAAAADDDKLTPSGQTQMAQLDSRKTEQGKTGIVEGSKGERKLPPSGRPEPMNDDKM